MVVSQMLMWGCPEILILTVMHLQFVDNLKRDQAWALTAATCDRCVFFLTLRSTTSWNTTVDQAMRLQLSGQSDAQIELQMA